jgi:enoyl-CoA hydratase/carnithine racemase
MSQTSSFQALSYQVQDGVAHLVFNRPARRNALDMTMRQEFLQAIELARHDDQVRAVVLRGAGGHFCSGGDVSSMRGAQMTAEQGRARMAPVVVCARALLELPKPVVAAVDGVAYGAGFGIALCADLLIATPAARFCLSFMRLGLVPDFASAFTLPRIVGAQRAKQLIYTATEIDGTQAHDWGIAAELCAPDKLEPRASAAARAMTNLSPVAFAMTKQMLLRAFTTELAVAGESEANAQGVAFNTAYHQRAAELLMAREPLAYHYPP